MFFKGHNAKLVATREFHSAPKYLKVKSFASLVNQEKNVTPLRVKKDESLSISLPDEIPETNNLSLIFPYFSKGAIEDL